MSISIILQEQQEAVDNVAEDPPRGENPVPEVGVEVERTPVLDSSPSSPPPTAPAPTDIAGPSYAAQQSPDHIHVGSRELATILASLDQRMARAEATIA